MINRIEDEDVWIVKWLKHSVLTHLFKLRALAARAGISIGLCPSEAHVLKFK